MIRKCEVQIWTRDLQIQIPQSPPNWRWTLLLIWPLCLVKWLSFEIFEARTCKITFGRHTTSLPREASTETGCGKFAEYSSQCDNTYLLSASLCKLDTENQLWIIVLASLEYAAAVNQLTVTDLIRVTLCLLLNSTCLMSADNCLFVVVLHHRKSI